MKSRWYVYILKCADGTLYSGVTTDVTRRVTEHNTSTKGAKYTRVRRPVRLAYTEHALSRSAAGKREAALKRLTRTQKQAVLAQGKKKSRA